MKPQSDCLSAGRGERRIKEDLASARAEPTVEIKMREREEEKEKKRKLHEW